MNHSNWIKRITPEKQPASFLNSMGAAASQDLFSKVQDHFTSVDEAVQDQNEYVRTTVMPATNQSTKEFLSTLVPPPPPLKRDRLKPIFEVANFSLPPAHQSMILGWAEHAELLPDLKVHAAEVYQALQSLSYCKETDQEDITFLTTVTRRFQYCIIYLLRCENQNQADSRLRGAFTNSISKTVGLDEDVVVEDISNWSHAAITFISMANLLSGFGVLLLLPTQVSRSVWEKHLTQKSSRFGDVVRHLQSLHLNDGAWHVKANEAAENILRSCDMFERLQAFKTNSRFDIQKFA